MSDVIFIGGSPSPTSRSSAVLRYAQAWLHEAGVVTDFLHVRDLDANALLSADTSNADIQSSVRRIEAVRAIVIGTPVYKAAYAGLLKVFLDLLPPRALQNKTVLPIATGGSSAHVLAIDYALKPVLSALGVQHILQGLYIVDAQIRHTPGEPLWIEAEIDHRLLRALDELSHILLTDAHRITTSPQGVHA
jgi:FMN reductase